MTKKLILSVLIAGLMAVQPVVGFACSDKKSNCGKCELKAQECKVTQLKNKVQTLWMNKDVLQINDIQMTKIKDIKKNAIKQLIQLDADKEIVMVDLKSAMWAESIDAASVNKLIDSKYASKNKTAKTYVKALSDIQNVLTKEQRAKWHELSVKDKMKGSKCSKCEAGSDGKICPITGKALGSKGSAKGSMK